MTRLQGLEDIEKALHVRYSESPEPQTVKVRLKLKGKSEFRTQGWYPIFFDTIVNCAAWGVVGSNVFEPKLGKAKTVSGPKRASKDVGPVLDWEVKVTAAAAAWIRLFVEHLSYRYNDTLLPPPLNQRSGSAASSLNGRRRLPTAPRCRCP